MIGLFWSSQWALRNGALQFIIWYTFILWKIRYLARQVRAPKLMEFISLNSKPLSVLFGILILLFLFSGITLLKMQIHQNLWKLPVKTPKFLLVIHFMHFFKLCWWFIMNDNYRQQSRRTPWSPSRWGTDRGVQGTMTMMMTPPIDDTGGMMPTW
jgi:hypothetical protein